MRKVSVFLGALAIAIVVVIVIAEPFASKPAGAAVGELRFADCLASDGADGCADPSPHSTVLGSAIDVAVSPDGKSVYVGGKGLSHFNRSADGVIGYAGCVQNGGSNACADPSPGNSPLSGNKHVAVSPDGKSVYVTASGDAGEPGGNSLSSFDRNTATGSLSFAGCFANGGANGCADPSPGNSPLGKAWDVAVSPDGKSVYVTSPGIGVNALSSFDRGADGSLSFAGCFGEDSGCDQIGGDPLNGLHGVSISPDGKNVYVAGSGAASLVTFNRATDGALSFATGAAQIPVPGTNRSTTLAASP